jgi:hypothetical protein
MAEPVCTCSAESLSPRTPSIASTPLRQVVRNARAFSNSSSYSRSTHVCTVPASASPPAFAAAFRLVTAIKKVLPRCHTAQQLFPFTASSYLNAGPPDQPHRPSCTRVLRPVRAYVSAAYGNGTKDQTEWGRTDDEAKASRWLIDRMDRLHAVVSVLVLCSCVVTRLNSTAAAMPPHDHSIALTNWHRCDLPFWEHLLKPASPLPRHPYGVYGHYHRWHWLCLLLQHRSILINPLPSLHLHTHASRRQHISTGGRGNGTTTLAGTAPTKVILVTGVTSGLGRALCDAFCDMGHTVVGCGRRAPLIAALTEAMPPRCTFNVVDTTNPLAVAAWAVHVHQQHQGGIDIELQQWVRAQHQP